MTKRPGGASAHYDDVRGEAAGDISDRLGNFLTQAAGTLGFSGPGFVVGISIFGGDEGGLDPELLHVTFQVVDTAGVDEIQKQLASTNGVLFVKEYHKMNVPIGKFIRCFKRFNASLFHRNIDATEVAVTGEIHLDDSPLD